MSEGLPDQDATQRKEDHDTYTRRQALGVLGIAALGGANYLGRHMQEDADVPPGTIIDLPKRGLEAHSDREIDLRKLEPEMIGKFVGPMYAEPLNLPLHRRAHKNHIGKHHEGELVAEIPPILTINGPDILNRLTAQKIARWTAILKKRNPPRTLSSEVSRLAEERISNYEIRWNDREKFPSRDEAIRRTSLPKLLGEIDGRIAPLKSALAEPQTRAHLIGKYGLRHAPEVLDTALGLADRIDSNFLQAYSMTEICPGITDGLFNAQFTNVELESLGQEGIANWPSSDQWPSFGPFQFTSLAIDDNPLVGAGVVNSALPSELQIPTTLDDLYNIEDHYAAAYLFAINNLIHAAAHLPEELAQLAQLDPETLTEFISTSHNGPTAALSILRMYLPSQTGPRPATYLECCQAYDAAHLKRDRNLHEREGKHYQPHIIVSMADYATKTVNNAAGLQEYLATHG